jgi:predicted HD phosphohydrolase
MESLSVRTTINTIINLYKKWGAADYIGEHLSQYHHSLQAGIFAFNELLVQNKHINTINTIIHINDINARKQYIKYCIICAAFLHDIGHLIGMENNADMMKLDSVHNLGITYHENIGASYLKSLGFPELVCHLVEKHVDAKRYLCSTDKNYIANLSDASANTMKLQGGIMTDDEIKKFELDEYFSLCLMIRYFDDQAKISNYFNLDEQNETNSLNTIIDSMHKVLIV